MKIHNILKNPNDLPKEAEGNLNTHHLSNDVSLIYRKLVQNGDGSWEFVLAYGRGFYNHEEKLWYGYYDDPKARVSNFFTETAGQECDKIENLTELECPYNLLAQLNPCPEGWAYQDWEEGLYFTTEIIGWFELPNYEDFFEEVGEYVDLNLPSGKKWAKCNIGAEKETDYGKCFQWGDMIGKSIEQHKVKPFTHKTAPFGWGEEFTKNMKSFCPNGILSPLYDVVFQTTNGKAHIPTVEDIDELLKYTKVSWVSNFNLSGINGIKCMSKADESKYIFIPTSPLLSKNTDRICTSYSGHIWSSTICNNYNDEAYLLEFDEFNRPRTTIWWRHYGLPIRGVMG